MKLPDENDIMNRNSCVWKRVELMLLGAMNENRTQKKITEETINKEVILKNEVIIGYLLYVIFCHYSVEYSRDAPHLGITQTKYTRIDFL